MKYPDNILPIDQYVIEYVLQLRKKHNLTQDAMGAILGVSRSYIANVENLNHQAKYNLGHINALADYFGVSPQSFLPAKPLPVEFSNKEEKKYPKQTKTIGAKKNIIKRGKNMP